MLEDLEKTKQTKNLKKIKKGIEYIYIFIATHTNLAAPLQHLQTLLQEPPTCM